MAERSTMTPQVHEQICKDMERILQVMIRVEHDAEDAEIKAEHKSDFVIFFLSPKNMTKSASDCIYASQVALPLCVFYIKMN